VADYDLLVLGAGPGGYPAAIRAAQLGLKTACVERENLGGVCLNWGCIPSKALLQTAELTFRLQHAGDWGLTVGEVGVDYAKVIGRSRKVAQKFEKGVGFLFRKHGVTSITGSGRLVGPGEVEVTAADGATSRITAKHVILATGARARAFPGIAPDGERILTYRHAIRGTVRPDSVIVLGAGAIGIEFAYFWRAMGAEVTVVEAQPEILPLEDAECAAEARKQLAKRGIRFVLGTFVDRVERAGDGCAVHLKGGEALSAQFVLVALGISPNVEELGLEALGVETGRGGIAVDSSHRTNVPGIYAVGDVCAAGPALAHTATRQAHVCVERIAGLHVPDVDYRAMPSCTYCEPQVASVGLTEAQAKEQGYEVKVGRFPFAANGKAYGAGHAEGFAKVIVDARFGEILGAHIVGAGATEMIGEFVLARTAEATAELLTHTVHAHPTHAEIALEAVADALGVSVHL
jgi:dihydrolipoamide dehydrogenase